MRNMTCAIVALAAIGCTKKAPPATGSASGSGSGSASAAVAIDAAVVAIDAPVVVDAPAATGPQITPAGVGGLGKFEWWKQKEDDAATLIDKQLGLPNVKTSFDVMDVPGEVEREEGYWSVKRGDKEIVQVIRAHDVDKEAPAVVIVWTPEIPTADGLKVGDPVSAVLAKHADLACTREENGLIAETVPADLTCKSAAEKTIIYIVSMAKTKVKVGKVAPASIANEPLVAIAHEP